MPQFLDTQTPFVPYKKTILEEIPEDILPSTDEFSTTSSADEAPLTIIEPPPDQSQDNKTNET